MASWVLENGLVSNSVRWMVQHPRIYDSFHARGLTKFSEMIDSLCLLARLILFFSSFFVVGCDVMIVFVPSVLFGIRGYV